MAPELAQHAEVVLTLLRTDVPDAVTRAMGRPAPWFTDLPSQVPVDPAAQRKLLEEVYNAEALFTAQARNQVEGWGTLGRDHLHPASQLANAVEILRILLSVILLSFPDEQGVEENVAGVNRQLADACRFFVDAGYPSALAKFIADGLDAPTALHLIHEPEA